MARFPIIQFGTSRFLQAHVDLFVSEAMQRAEALGPIAVVQTTESAENRRRLGHFAAGLPYPVIIRGLTSGAVVDTRVEVGSVHYGAHASDQWEEVVALFCQARCMISNTGDRGFELDPSDAPDSARSFPAKLARLLIARWRAGSAPMTLLPCELVPMNGSALSEAVGRTLERWGAPEAARRWIAEECVWANSLVDRIVSQSLEPAGAVAEPYALWAIEDQPRLEVPCRHSDIVVTGDIRPYMRLKLFILNLGHSWLAELSRESRASPSLTVREAMADPALRGELDSLYVEEVLPVFAAIGMGREAEAYRATVVERFSNPFLDHRFADILVNHEAKKKIRFGGLIELARSSGLALDQPRLKRALAEFEPRFSAASG